MLKEREASSVLNRQALDLEKAQKIQAQSIEQNDSLRSAFNADRQILQDKIDDLERKLTTRMKENQSLEQKIHMQLQSESSQKNELNFWNGKVSTLRRDLEYQQTFAENMQGENQKLQGDVEGLTRAL